MSDINQAVRNRLKGVFWGLVVGDCLGSPIQFTSKDSHPHITEMKPCPCFKTPAGYWTDDAAMAFCVAESFVRLGGAYDLADIGRNFVRWFDEGFWSSLPYAFDIGNATASALIRVRRDGSLANGTEETQGNGSIMRLAPSYIMSRGRGEEGVRLRQQISDLTHRSAVVRAVVDKMSAILDEHVEGRRTAIRSRYRTRDEVDNSGWAVSTLEAALWAFETTGSFEDGLIAAVNLGGDADTIGAVYGQLGGGYYGFTAIPERWLDAVKEREKIDCLIDALVSLSAGTTCDAPRATP